MNGLYVVRATPQGRHWVVVADNGGDAAVAVARRIADAQQIEIKNVPADDFEVGRLGDYNPGHMGHRIMVAAGKVIG